VITASGCGAMVKDYGHLLAHDPAYAAKAARVSALAKDLLEVIEPEAERLKALLPSSLTPHPPSFAFHPPCTLQHGMKMKGRAEALLAGLGFTLTPVANAHLCCGSAGTYSLTQPELSQQLLANKIASLEAGAPTAILTANIGCQLHLQSATGLPVRHWIEALDARMSA
jgi:glycolate oxidase iron-sulfur subunit